MRSVLVVAILVAVTLSGCASSEDATDPVTETVADLGPYVMEGVWSTPRQPALFEKLPAFQVDVPVADGTEMAIGVFMPDIEGCDWDAAELPEDCHLPVVMDAGPYYTDRIDIDKGRPQWVEWLVPRGYIVVQMALRGTGESGGCMGFKAPSDADDISDVVDWIAAQPWSNGNVGVAGRSYDGTSAWAAAASGNPHVKTIMPISGAVDGPKLYFRNGTHELRVLIPHIPTYWATYALGIGGDDPLYRGTDIVANVCPEVVEAHVYGPMSAFTGDAGSEYWQSRILSDDILQNYNGSAWVIHGMIDWNVDPSQAVPFVNEMIDAGIETRAWLGQWGHAYPDHSPEHSNVRWDWADQIVSWFDFYLRDAGEQPWLGIEVEDDMYRWRQESHYPPRNATWHEFTVGETGTLVTNTFDALWRFTAEEDMLVAGLPQIKIDAIPMGTGGQIGAELFDDTQGKRIGWGVIDLRHPDGGNTDPDVVVPGQPMTLHLQFEPTDSAIAAGDELRIVLTRGGVEDINPDTNPGLIQVDRVVVRLPTVAEDDFIDIPLTEDDLRYALYQELHA